MDITSLILELFTNADHFLMVLATEYGWFVYLAMFLTFWKRALWCWLSCRVTRCSLFQAPSLQPAQ